MKWLRSRFDPAYWTILANAASLVGSLGVTSILGFVYWLAAAHLFPPMAVGLASAAISAMTLLATVALLGMGTLLMGELPSRRGQEFGLIAAAVLIAGAAGAALGLIFAAGTTTVSTQFRPLVEDPKGLALFAIGVALTAVALLFDSVLIGLLRGDLQLGRNALYAAGKLGALLLAGIWLHQRVGLSLFATWIAGNALSLVGLALFGAMNGHLWRVRGWVWRGLRSLKLLLLGSKDARLRPTFTTILGVLGSRQGAALAHHAVNLAVQFPGLAMPVIVTIVLSARSNASFYVAWNVLAFLFVVPFALTSVLYAVGAGEPTLLARKIRLTIGVSLTVGLSGILVLLITGRIVLGWFGPSYADQASWILRVMAFGIIPLIIKDHYVAVRRLERKLGTAALVTTAGGIVEISSATLGALLGGLQGLSVGWLLGLSLEAAVMSPTIYWSLAPARKASGTASANTPGLQRVGGGRGW